MSKVLFLDCDGVVNCRLSWPAGGKRDPVDAHKVELLHEVIAATGCKIVLSSTWRKFEASSEKIKRLVGRKHFHSDWRTGEATLEVVNGLITSTQVRGSEIAEWLSRHPETKSYAIVDDDGDMLPSQALHFVQTTFAAGLLPEHARALTEILGRKGEAGIPVRLGAERDAA